MRFDTNFKVSAEALKENNSMDLRTINPSILLNHADMKADLLRDYKTSKEGEDKAKDVLFKGIELRR